MSDSQKQSLVQLWPKYGFELTTYSVNLDKGFSRSAPKVMDIGFGIGTTLYEMAKKYPSHDFIGVEVYRAGISQLLSKVDEAGLSNVKVYHADVVEVLNSCIADESLDRIQIYFPDPWPKARHHKRRLVNEQFVDLLTKKLVTGGILAMATDWQNYAEQMQLSAESCKKLEPYTGDDLLERPITKFERRGLKLGHQISELKYKKRSFYNVGDLGSYS